MASDGECQYNSNTSGDRDSQTLLDLMQIQRQLQIQLKTRYKHILPGIIQFKQQRGERITNVMRKEIQILFLIQFLSYKYKCQYNSQYFMEKWWIGVWYASKFEFQEVIASPSLQVAGAEVAIQLAGSNS